MIGRPVVSRTTPPKGCIFLSRLCYTGKPMLVCALLPVLVAQSPLALVPWPNELELGSGTCSVPRGARIVCSGEGTTRAGRVLQADLVRVTGRPWTLTQGSSRPGDIVLRSTAGPSADGSYKLLVWDRIQVSAQSYSGLSAGSATALQLLHGGGDVPRLSIDDKPRYPFRSAMLDLARKVHTIEGIKQVVDLCRLYKVNYLHLHLSDDHLFMFPSKAFPQVGKGNHEFARFEPPSMSGPIRPYRREDLTMLDQYAADRGVDLIPEIDLPGHSSRLVEDCPKVFRATDQNTATLDVSSPTAIAGCKTLLNELMDVFKHSPYIHIGGDEVWMGGFDELPSVADARNRWSASNAHDLYRRFLADMAAHVLARGRRPIIWESSSLADFGTKFPLPKRTTIMLWSTESDPTQFTSRGFDVVNGAWTPMYIVRNDKKSFDFMLGWSPDQIGFELEKMAYKYRLSDHLLGSQLMSWENPECSEIQSLRRRLAIMAEKCWSRPTANLRYRVNTMDAVAERYINDVNIHPVGRLVRDENSFEDPLTVAMAPRLSGAIVRYTTDNTLPTKASTAYAKPFQLTDSAWVRAAPFDRTGKQIGRVSGAWYRSVPKFLPNLATRKPVTVMNAEGGDPSLAVDGNLDPDRHWAGKTPASLTVDLQGEFLINKATLVTYSDKSRFYQFKIDVSLDGEAWSTVADASANSLVAAPNGYQEQFAPTRARYVRVEMLKNSANEGTHIVELMVFEAKGKG